MPTYNAWSADGDVTGKLVFANYGLPEDYDKLADMGIDVKGKIVITKYGKPVAKLVPVDPQGDDIFGFLRGKVTITGDVVSPPLSRREWGNLK